jgi:hypothetical protein
VNSDHPRDGTIRISGDVPPDAHLLFILSS